MHVLAINPDGSIQFIYNDDFAALLDEGEARVMRASHVEPTADGRGWVADMSPVGGPVLGAAEPFALRGAALAAEVAYLNQHLFGVGGQSNV